MENEDCCLISQYHSSLLNGVSTNQPPLPTRSPCDPHHPAEDRQCGGEAGKIVKQFRHLILFEVIRVIENSCMYM